MYVETSCAHTVLVPAKHPPRERYRQYYRDLHERYKMTLDETTFSTGSHCKYHELSYNVFDALVREEILGKLDFMAITYWAHEFDPDHAALGTHLAYRYQISGCLFDVLDQGNLCTLTTLLLLKKINAKNSLCLSLDQNTIPRGDNDSFPIPTKSAAVALCLSSEKINKEAIKIIDVIVWPEKIICDAKLNFIELLIEILDKNNIDLQACILSCKRNSMIYRAMKCYQYQYEHFFSKVEFNFLPIQSGCTDVSQYIHNLSKNKVGHKKRYHLYLEEDVESLTAGLVILDAPQKGNNDYAIAC